MGTAYSHMTMSLDGYIADPDDRCDELFGWYGAGTVTVPSPALAPSCVGGACSTSPRGGATATPVGAAGRGRHACAAGGR